MSSNDEVKSILYSTIERIGKERILTDSHLDINSSEKYIDFIMAECIKKINAISNNSNNDDTKVILSEALLHFMLTVCTLPSERKIQLKDGLMLDVIVPNLRTLKKTPDKSIIIEIVRKKIDSDKVSKLEVLQPNYKNIWLVSAIPFSTKYTLYGISPGRSLFDNTFSSIITDISDFLLETGNKTLRLIH